MDGHCACSCISVVLSQKRVVRRSEEGLSSTCSDTSHEDEHHHSACKSSEHRRHTPEEDRDSCHPFAAEAVARHSSERHHTCVAEVEDGSDQSYRSVCKAQRVTDCREDGVEHLAISLVEQICHPKQGQNLPFIVFSSVFHII